MNIKISKKRAAKILQEEVQKFLQENKDIIPKDLKEFLEQTVAEQEPTLKKVDSTVNEATKEITEALNTLTGEITKLGKL